MTGDGIDDRSGIPLRRVCRSPLTTANGLRRSHGNQHMAPPERSSHRGQSNAATAIALFGLVLMGAALLGLMALVLPQLLGVVVVVLIFAVPAAFHYLVWGWWMSQGRD